MSKQKQSDRNNNDLLGEQLNGVFSEFIIKPLDSTLESRLAQIEHRWFGDPRNYPSDETYAEVLQQQQLDDIQRSLEGTVRRLEGALGNSAEQISVDIGAVLNRLKKMHAELEGITAAQNNNSEELRKLTQELEQQLSQCHTMVAQLQSDGEKNTQQIRTCLEETATTLSQKVSQAASQAEETSLQRAQSLENSVREGIARQAEAMEVFTKQLREGLDRCEESVRQQTGTLQEALAKQKQSEKLHRWILYGAAAVIVIMEVIQLIV